MIGREGANFRNALMAGKLEGILKIQMKAILILNILNYKILFGQLGIS